MAGVDEVAERDVLEPARDLVETHPAGRRDVTRPDEMALVVDAAGRSARGEIDFHGRIVGATGPAAS